MARPRLGRPTLTAPGFAVAARVARGPPSRRFRVPERPRDCAILSRLSAPDARRCRAPLWHSPAGPKSAALGTPARGEGLPSPSQLAPAIPSRHQNRGRIAYHTGCTCGANKSAPKPGQTIVAVVVSLFAVRLQMARKPHSTASLTRLAYGLQGGNGVTHTQRPSGEGPMPVTCCPNATRASPCR